MDRSLEGVFSLISSIIQPPLEFWSNLYGSLYLFIRNWPFGKRSSNFVSYIIRMLIFLIVIPIELLNVCLTELIFRWTIKILLKFFWWISLRYFIFIRERLNVALYSSQLWKSLSSLAFLRLCNKECQYKRYNTTSVNLSVNLIQDKLFRGCSRAKRTPFLKSVALVLQWWNLG